MVERQQKKYGWEFLSIGANMDAVAESQKFGIRSDRAVNYVCDDKGTGVVYAAVNKAVGAMRSAQAGCAAFALDASCWSEEIAEDYEKRKR